MMGERCDGPTRDREGFEQHESVDGDGVGRESRGG